MPSLSIARRFDPLWDSHLEAMNPGWFSVGKKCDVPKDACYVGQCGKTYIWVMRDGMDSLTKVTLAILDIASAAPTSFAVLHLTPEAVHLAQLKSKAATLADLLSKYPRNKLTK